MLSFRCINFLLFLAVPSLLEIAKSNAGSPAPQPLLHGLVELYSSLLDVIANSDTRPRVKVATASDGSHAWTPGEQTESKPWRWCSLTSGGGVHAVVRVVVADVSVPPASRSLPVDDRLGSTLGRLRRPHQRHDQDEQRWQLRWKYIYLIETDFLCIESDLHVVVYLVYWHPNTRAESVSPWSVSRNL